MRKLKRPHKNLFILEAGFIYCKRRNVDYDSDKFIDECFMTSEFNLGENSEFDKIYKDLRSYRYFETYSLVEISEDEYEMCVDEFGEQ